MRCVRHTRALCEAAHKIDQHIGRPAEALHRDPLADAVVVASRRSLRRFGQGRPSSSAAHRPCRRGSGTQHIPHRSLRTLPRVLNQFRMRIDLFLHVVIAIADHGFRRAGTVVCVDLRGTFCKQRLLASNFARSWSRMI